MTDEDIQPGTFRDAEASSIEKARDILKQIQKDMSNEPKDYSKRTADAIARIKKKVNSEETKEKFRKNAEAAKTWHLTAKPEYNESLIEQYDFFRKNVYNPQRVFYPCSGIDASPVKGFPDSEIILMDLNKDTDYIMKNNNVNCFIQGDVLTYTPEKPFDLIIILNPQEKSRNLTKHLIQEGYVIANNWHNNASQLLEDKNFEGIGTIIPDKKGIYLTQKDFNLLSPQQFETLFYVFKKLGVGK